MFAAQPFDCNQPPDEDDLRPTQTKQPSVIEREVDEEQCFEYDAEMFECEQAIIKLVDSLPKPHYRQSLKD